MIMQKKKKKASRIHPSSGTTTKRPFLAIFLEKTRDYNGVVSMCMEWVSWILDLSCSVIGT